MKQYRTFDDLLALGTEKIHEQTHISRDKVELVMTKSYGEIGRVQFMGFMSILEREYGVDLSDIKEEYLAFQQEHLKIAPEKKSVILQASTNSKPKWIAAGAAVIVLLMIGGYLAQNKMSNGPKEEVMQLTTVGMETAAETADLNATDANETNQSLAVAAKVEENQTKVISSDVMPIEKGVVIYPVFKVWYGMIDLSSKERIQNITADPIRIDTAKNWLIILGHGRITIETAAGKTESKEKNTIRFICENGTIKEISKEEFEARNGGKGW